MNTETKHAAGVSPFGDLWRDFVTSVSAVPLWFRPFAAIAMWFWLLLMMIVAVPMSIVILFRHRGHSRFVRSVSSHAARIWSEESPEASYAMVESVYAALRSAYPRRTEVPPFGSVRSELALPQIADMLFDSLAQRREWAGGLQLADDVIQMTDHRAHWKWQIAKAKCLRQLGRETEAIEILRSLLPERNAGSEAQRLLDQWSQSGI